MQDFRVGTYGVTAEMAAGKVFCKQDGVYILFIFFIVFFFYIKAVIYDSLSILIIAYAIILHF